MSVGALPLVRVPVHPRRVSQAGFSLIEILMASFIGLLAMVGILYLYKSQHKNMLIQSSIADMRMNTQYTLSEVQHYLAHAGLGLPEKFENILMDGNDMVVRSNGTKKSAVADLDESVGSSAAYLIPLADTALFDGKAFAVAMRDGKYVESTILTVTKKNAVHGLVTLKEGPDKFEDKIQLYPMDRVRLHRCTGIGADKEAGEFKVLKDAGSRGLDMDSLALAEGIDSLAYRYILVNGTVQDAMPDPLDNLKSIEIRVMAKTLIKDIAISGGYRRDTMTTRVSYRRSL